MDCPLHPTITKVTPTDEGFSARALCHINGFPGEVRLNVETIPHGYVSFTIHLFDPVAFRWMPVDSMTLEEMPREENEERLTWLNRIASALWERADMIVRTAHRRQEEWETATFLAQQRALRHEVTVHIAPTENATQDAFTAVDRGVLVEDH